MNLAYLLIFGTIVLLSVTVIALFTWAIRNGQFSDFQQGATSIFDDDEPLGEMTDWFPDHAPNQHPDRDASVARNSPEANRKIDVDRT